MTRHSIPASALLLAAMVLAACTPAPPEQTEFSSTLTVSNGSDPGPLTAPQVTFSAGEPITFTVASSNNTDQARDINWCDGSRFDIAVYDAVGTLVWNWYYGLAFTQALEPDQYGPREERRTAAEWDQYGNDGAAVTPGTYYAIASACAYWNQQRIDGFTTDAVDFEIR